MIFYYICQHTSDLATLTEHWLTDLDSAVRVELCLSGYKILDHTRSGRRGGGTSIIYHESLNVKKIDPSVVARYSYEFSGWLVISGRYSIRIAIIYRPPGDFNIHVDDCSNPGPQKFLDLLNSFGLQQQVKQATHRDGQVLDLSITCKLETFIDDEPTVDIFISDHAVVFTRLGLLDQVCP